MLIDLQYKQKSDVNDADMRVGSQVVKEADIGSTVARKAEGKSQPSGLMVCSEMCRQKSSPQMSLQWSNVEDHSAEPRPLSSSNLNTRGYCSVSNAMIEDGILEISVVVGLLRL